MILIHICCADCGLKMVDEVKRDLKLANSDISLYFYNPNIHPEAEFTARMKAVQRVFN